MFSVTVPPQKDFWEEVNHLQGQCDLYNLQNHRIHKEMLITRINTVERVLEYSIVNWGWTIPIEERQSQSGSLN